MKIEKIIRTKNFFTSIIKRKNNIPNKIKVSFTRKKADLILVSINSFTL